MPTCHTTLLPISYMGWAENKSLIMENTSIYFHCFRWLVILYLYTSNIHYAGGYKECRKDQYN